MRPLHHSGESGQALVFATLSITVLFGALGLAVDLGFSYSVKQRLQTAADAAAGAAAKYALDNSDSCGTGGTVTCPATLTCSRIQTPGNSLQAGCDYGLTGAPSGMTLSLTENTGGLTGDVTAKVWIQATATISSPIFFISPQSTKATVKAQATAGVTAFSGGGCIYVLDATASPALSATGNTTVSSSDCGIYVASSASNAINAQGSSTVNATGGGEVVIDCGACYYTSGTSTVYYDSGTSHVAPAVGVTNNPLATLQGPSWTASGCKTANYPSGSITYPLTNGVYCGGITVGGNNTVNLAAGTYILDGGGFNITNSAKVNGTGVTIYIISDASHPAGGLNIGGNATVNLTAPTSGTYQGIVFFQDKTVTSAATVANSANGTITGTYYFPTAAFNLTGNVQGTTTAAFIVDTLTVTGSSSLSNDPTGKVTGINRSYAGLLQ